MDFTLQLILYGKQSHTVGILKTQREGAGWQRYLNNYIGVTNDKVNRITYVTGVTRGKQKKKFRAGKN